jgi:hypothetical protein
VAVSDSDRLNGITEEYVITENAAIRQSEDHNTGWTAWTMDNLTVTIAKLADKREMTRSIADSVYAFALFMSN